jgi:hypothetical protein
MQRRPNKLKIKELLAHLRTEGKGDAFQSNLQVRIFNCQSHEGNVQRQNREKAMLRNEVARRRPLKRHHAQPTPTNKRQHPCWPHAQGRGWHNFSTTIAQSLVPYRQFGECHTCINTNPDKISGIFCSPHNSQWKRRYEPQGIQISKGIW